MSRMKERQGRAHISQTDLVFVTPATMWLQPSAPRFLPLLCLMVILLLSNVTNERLHLFSLTLDHRVKRESNQS